MSAHCNKHGCDLVYPEGSWPLGECRECVLESELAAARAALERIAGACEDEVPCAPGAPAGSCASCIARAALAAEEPA